MMNTDLLVARFAALPLGDRALLVVGLLLVAAVILAALPGLPRLVWRRALRPGARVAAARPGTFRRADLGWPARGVRS